MHSWIRRGTWLLIATLALGTACRSATIYDAERKTLPQTGSLELVKKDIERAGRIQGWEFEEVGPGKLIGIKRHGKHGAWVTIEYNEQSFSIRYRNSSNLRQSGGKIHKAYNVWVKALENSIRREVSSR